MAESESVTSSGVLKSLYRDIKSQIDPKSSQPQDVPAYDITKDGMAFKKIFRDIRLQISVGLKLHQVRRTNVDSQFMDVYVELDLLIDPVEKLQQTIIEGVSKFDFVQSDGTPVKANGYRSLIHVLKQLLSYLLNHLQKYARDRGSMFYNAADSLSNITAYTRALQGMERICHHAHALMTVSDAPVLYNNGEMKKSLLSLLYTDTACRDAFYGRCLGFQYAQGMPILQFLAIAMASYEDWYKGTKEDPVKQLLNSLWKGGKYIQHPTQRGIKIAELTDDCSIYFAKAFWSITEQTAVKTAVKMVSQAVDISETLEVPAKNITIQSVEGESITLNPPFSDLGYKPISVTLISHKLREGQTCSGYGRKARPLAPSSGLIIHFHGGGFVAQSSKSHEFYLRWWSKDLDCPILSVDYSLAPEAPYPRALEECLFVYAWALNNLNILGTTGERILLAGDSAGGYFTITTAMKINQLGLRPPDQIFAFYPATIISSAVSPSRFLSLMDPLLPIGILLSCLQAYTGGLPNDELRTRRKEIRDRILAAKGYIIPSLNDPYVAQKPQTRWDKLKGGLQRSQTLPADMDDIKTKEDGVKKNGAPPPRPPPITSPTSSLGTKPSRPPPPRGEQRRATVGPISTELSVSFNPNEETVECHNNGLNKNGVIMEEEEEEGEGGEGDQQVNDVSKDLTEVNLKDNPPPRPSSPPKGRKLSQPDDCEQSVSSSVAPFFPKTSEKVQGLRFGRKVPAKEDMMTDEEIEALVTEVIDSFEDAEITTTDPFISPALSPDHLLTGLPLINLIVCSLDPLLDDGIMMAQRLKSLEQPVTLTVMENLSHGFLSLTGTEQLNIAYAKTIAMMKEALKIQEQPSNDS